MWDDLQGLSAWKVYGMNQYMYLPFNCKGSAEFLHLLFQCGPHEKRFYWIRFLMRDL